MVGLLFCCLTQSQGLRCLDPALSRPQHRTGIILLPDKSGYLPFSVELTQSVVGGEGRRDFRGRHVRARFTVLFFGANLLCFPVFFFLSRCLVSWVGQLRPPLLFLEGGGERRPKNKRKRKRKKTDNNRSIDRDTTTQDGHASACQGL